MSNDEKVFFNLNVSWIAPNINNWDVEFVYTYSFMTLNIHTFLFKINFIQVQL